MRRVIWRLTLLAAIAVSASAADEQETRERLQQLTREIEAITRKQREDEARQGELQRSLRQAETEMAALQARIDSLEADIDATSARLDTLASERERLSARRDDQRAQISRDVRQAWQLGNQGQVKLLLNQDSPQTLSRVSAYYGYLFRARQARIEDFRATIDALSDVVLEVLATRKQLTASREDLEGRRLALERARQERQQTLAKIAADMEARGASLAQLEQDREQLESLLEEIEATVQELQVPENVQAFAERRGAMPWPVSGRRSNSFGRPRNQGKMVWHGINIEAQAGSAVQAIHHGRVVYADWLRGSGLLLVIDHGDSYMSLYAHNETLLREVGEWVTAGTAISTVGDSGGRETPGLYFEIRHKGKPVDPAAWCQR
ncbi:murein hydrolase activator EnvC family protein [Chromatocurvus halotolerans]|uniref:Septal ring factor EnvC (AmiA/AmiB activator) n=1 Tax=Chromatocurvus halotolerans TaxID=1132028 RepID=A0A4R2KZJ5_9GAMM|nr:peptidoglycan DD-metalloendopeptidase family protein [Chromatocurvus halotolerans]TCO76816.1 septal ring factor EnvC (AmiA/AmiB activator) [Chromatocurvus halotolerans]